MPAKRSESPPIRGLFVAMILALGLTVIGFGQALSPAAAETAEDTQTATDSESGGASQDEAERLRLGAEVYTQICSSCHQAGGAGITGSFPPLVDNPNVDDAAYVADVIANGRQGEITVGAETYNGVMPSFSTLTDEEVSATIAYIQNDFKAPAATVASGPTGPVAGTELPALTNMGWQATVLIALLVVALVVGPRLTNRIDRLNTPWFEVGLKTLVITVAAVLVVAYIPDWILQNGTVAALPRILQDLIGVVVWGVGLFLLFFFLWYAHEDERI